MIESSEDGTLLENAQIVAEHEEAATVRHFSNVLLSKRKQTYVHLVCKFRQIITAHPQKLIYKNRQKSYILENKLPYGSTCASKNSYWHKLITIYGA